MSHYYGYYCRTCDTETERGYNHGDQMLAAVARLYPLIKALKDAADNTAAAGYLEIGLMADNDEVFNFLLEHGDHDLVVKSEYSSVPPIEIKAALAEQEG